MRPTPDLDWFATSFRKLCYRLEPPVRTEIGGQPFYRFKDTTIQAAILLKTARYVSGLHACRLLLNNGFFQELGTLQRSIDDFGQDATFLALAYVTGKVEEIHVTFLSSFWKEEPTFEDFLKDQKKKHEIPRSNIQSHISRTLNNDTPEFREIGANKHLSRMYSGYTHGAAPHTMDMYNPVTRAIEVSGSTSRSLLEDHEYDFQNQLFRGVVLIAMVSHALGDTALENEADLLQKSLAPHYHK